LSLAGGAAAEVFDILAHRDFAKSVQFHMIDIDDYAMEFLDWKATEIGVRESLTLHRANVFRLRLVENSAYHRSTSLIASA
jgi:hypothetical protein